MKITGVFAVIAMAVVLLAISSPTYCFDWGEWMPNSFCGNQRRLVDNMCVRDCAVTTGENAGINTCPEHVQCYIKNGIGRCKCNAKIQHGEPEYECHKLDHVTREEYDIAVESYDTPIYEN